MSEQPVIVNVQNNFWRDSEQPISEEMWSLWFTTWLQMLETSLPEAQVYELSLRLTDDHDMTQFNAQYRNQNRSTDVLAFAALESEIPVSEDYLDESLYLGDLIISVETAARQAEEKGHSLVLELAWLASHGCLHLLGWDHPDDSSLELMLNQQEKLLQLVGLEF